MAAGERQLEASIWIDAAPERVFDALTSSAAIVEYFPLEEVTSSWREGGELCMRGTANGAPFTDQGFIEIFDRPRELAYSYWSDNHGTPNRPEHHVSISYRLEPGNGGTTLSLLQKNLPSPEWRSLMRQVWPDLLGSLKAYVESRRYSS